MSSYTLEEALTKGRGTERPFRCHVHDDSTASASVNVLKGVWYCYACRASGSVSDAKPPAIADLLAMVKPEEGVRVYPESYLDLFDTVVFSHWMLRFPAWLVHQERLGHDPFTGQATFPVRTPEGRLAGVGRRNNDPEVKPKYRYPPRWSAAQSLHGWPSSSRGGILVLTEGVADRVSVLEFGCQALACYGAGLHTPQRDLVIRMKPDIIVLGFDMDDAGERACDQTADLLTDYPVVRAEWYAKDPADSELGDREYAVLKAVGGHNYPESQARQEWVERLKSWRAQTRRQSDDGRAEPPRA